jgi:hypothetical protein
MFNLYLVDVKKTEQYGSLPDFGISFNDGLRPSGDVYLSNQDSKRVKCPQAI